MSSTLSGVRLPTVPARSDTADQLPGGPFFVDGGLNPTTSPLSSKFTLVYPEDAAGLPRTKRHPPMVLMDTEDETTTSDAEDALNSRQQNGTSSSKTLPRLARAFSVPLASQLKHLRHPRSPQPVMDSPLPPEATIPDHHELSMELADSVQMVTQTLLQLSPPHLLDPAKEQFSPCSLQVPTPSMSALLTLMKNLNYLSAHLPMFYPPSSLNGGSMHPISTIKEDFDVGEVLQGVGDALGGVAAQAGVDLVLFHGDVGIRHVSVKGDECGISSLLSHVIRQVLTAAQRGDTIELGLHIATSPESANANGVASEDGPLLCTIDIAHKFFVSDSQTGLEDAGGTRPSPRFNTQVLSCLLPHLQATLRTDLKPKNFELGRGCEVLIFLERGSPLAESQHITPEEEAIRQPFPNLRLASEPTLDELSAFAETLKGRRAIFHASSEGSFAHHLTSYLTAWGLDVSHVPTDGPDDAMANGLPEKEIPQLRPDISLSGSTSISPIPEASQSASSSSFPVPGQERKQANESDTTFVIIDDDVEVLRRQLFQVRGMLLMRARPRPSLAAHHRPKSSPLIRQYDPSTAAMTPDGPANPAPPFQPNTSVVIVHFTSLANYRLVKDAVQEILSSGPVNHTTLPEVIVIPKPAGPRRFLTALHTAVKKPIVDPFFYPIATSPMSPNGHGPSPFFDYPNTTPRSERPTPPATSRAPSDRQPNRPNRDRNHSDASTHNVDPLEYFSEAASKMGGSASSGLMIQSPDGRPAGIFFQPRPKSTSRAGSYAMEREQARLPPRRGTGPSRLSSAPNQIDPKTALEGLIGQGGPPNRSPTSSRAPLADRPPPDLPPLVPTQHDSPVSPKSKGVAGYPSGASQHSPSQPLGSEAIPRPSSPQSRDRQIRDASDLKSDSPATDRQDIFLDPGALRRIHSPQLPSKNSSPQDKSTFRRQTLDGKPKGTDIVPPIKVLVVEDNPINQTILSTFLRKKKIAYGVANNGQEAVEKWRTGGYHLILMDIQMPVMDGIQATQEIRRLEKSNNIGIFPTTPTGSDGTKTPSSSVSTGAPPSPYRSSVIIVALTASALQSDRVAALAAGCNDFLTKPVSLIWLDKKIIEWGSIKALQKWADPELARSLNSGQDEKANLVASQLRIVRSRSPGSRSTPPQASSPQAGPSRQPTISVQSPTPNASPVPAVSFGTGGSPPQGSPPLHDPQPLSESRAPPEAQEGVISGEDALRSFIEDSQQDHAKLQDHSRPVVLGQRGLSQGDASISSVIHGSRATGPSPPNAANAVTPSNHSPPDASSSTSLVVGANDVPEGMRPD